MVGGELSEKVRERQGVHIPVLFCRGLCHGRPMAAPTDPDAHSLTVDGGGDPFPVCRRQTHSNCAQRAQFHNGVSHYFTFCKAKNVSAAKPPLHAPKGSQAVARSRGGHWPPVSDAVEI